MPLSWPASVPEPLWEQAFADIGRARELANELYGWPTRYDDGTRAGSWCRIGIAEARLGSTDLARSAGAHARVVFTAHADERGLALCRVIDALCLNREGHPADALRLLLDASLLGDGEHDDFEAFVYRSARAEIHASLVETDTAFADYYLALKTARRLPAPSASIVAARDLGEYHRRLGNFAEARRHGEDALLAASRVVASRSVVASVAASLVHTYFAIGARDKISDLMSLIEADPPIAGWDEPPSHADALALGHFAGGHVREAYALVEPAVVRHGIEASPFRAWLLARCQMGFGRWSDANAVALEGLSLWSAAERPDHRYDLVKLYEVASECFEALGDAARALEHIRLLGAVRERMLAFSLRSQDPELRVKHETAQLRSERDSAVEQRLEGERDIARLQELNRSLQERVLEIAQLQAELREQSVRDPLTGLHNRRYLYETAEGHLELARRQRVPVCVVMIDLDHFKKINDAYGHHAGDDVLKEFAHLISVRARKSDIVCRYGGEEFVMLMADIEADDAMSVLDKLLTRFRELPIPTHRGLLRGCSFSAGIAVLPADGESLQALLHVADQRLYGAKTGGRGRFEAG